MEGHAPSRAVVVLVVLAGLLAGLAVGVLIDHFANLRPDTPGLAGYIPSDPTEFICGLRLDSISRRTPLMCAPVGAAVAFAILYVTVRRRQP
ncbi:MAG TPA: hypothetical protein VGF55_20440 [Gemmataceae bacterium]